MATHPPPPPPPPSNKDSQHDTSTTVAFPFRVYLVQSHLQERLEHPVAPQLHGLEVDPQQAIDELRVSPVVWPHTHGALEHPCSTETRVVCVDGSQRLLVHSLSLQSHTLQWIQLSLGSWPWLHIMHYLSGKLPRQLKMFERCGQEGFLAMACLWGNTKTAVLQPTLAVRCDKRPAQRHPQEAIQLCCYTGGFILCSS